MHRFYIPPDQATRSEPVIEGTDARHIQTVLRLKPGDPIVVFDGQGTEYAARIVALDRRQVRIALSEQRTVDTESPLKIALAQSYLKDKKMDLLVRQVVELGVNHFIPFMARRSVPQPDAERTANRRRRWQKIALEAVKQCRRQRPMEVAPVHTFEETLALARPYALKLFFWEVQGDHLFSDPQRRPRPDSVFIMIGPEGGFEAGEYEAARAHGFEAVQMGPRILRVETAAIAACTLVQYLFGDMGTKIA
ncbi:16S rRNA (uracil(1498)-N(3))-methyltransferase [Desulfatitalea alkaliphila]|uniref:Ribosomal RNA small subunit methyltransferase E n=1 Tax=Desulfatitalea alkaliphila TaxID=2929485 RepID=A0AA41R7U4_9BACT|nr:16S rRNA (uracil(1498)-N(3))-methyltransferase [Desulfatitalea alkaliphila]MCJ8502586.1 16S rRNA (uracil(1498)-N(3))-methyltransferase [Desulfatitalea alkaliphila]